MLQLLYPCLVTTINTAIEKIL